MGGVVSSIFGGGGSGIQGTDIGKNIGMFPTSQAYINKNLNFDTGFSNLNQKTGQINIDPTGRNLNLGALGQYSQNLGQTRESLLGNQGAFMNARVNPLIEQLAMGRGQLQRETARTGVRGTFRDQAMQNYDIQGNRALADQRALATNDTLSALNILDQNLFNAGTGVGTNINNQELAALGLSANTIQALKSIASNLTTGAASTAAQASAAAANADQARQNNILGTLGMLGIGASGLGLFGGGAAAAGAGQGASSLGALTLAGPFSDRRLKKNIKKIGNLNNGLNLYEFDYIWDEHATGVMADEVIKVIPEAVSFDPSGYMMVDYSKVLSCQI